MKLDAIDAIDFYLNKMAQDKDIHLSQTGYKNALNTLDILQRKGDAGINEAIHLLYSN